MASDAAIFLSWMGRLDVLLSTDKLENVRGGPENSNKPNKQHKPSLEVGKLCSGIDFGVALHNSNREMTRPGRPARPLRPGRPSRLPECGRLTGVWQRHRVQSHPTAS